MAGEKIQVLLTVAASVGKSLPRLCCVVSVPREFTSFMAVNTHEGYLPLVWLRTADMLG